MSRRGASRRRDRVHRTAGGGDPDMPRLRPRAATARFRGLSALAAVAVIAAAMAGCTKAAAPTNPGPSGKAVKGGDVTFAESPGVPPNYIFPLDALQYFSTNNINQFQYLMWRPLYWIGNGSDVTLNESLS